MSQHHRIRWLARVCHWLTFSNSWGLTAIIVLARDWCVFDRAMPLVITAGIAAPFVIVALAQYIARARRAQWWRAVEAECEEATPLASHESCAGGRRVSAD